MAETKTIQGPFHVPVFDCTSKPKLTSGYFVHLFQNFVLGSENDAKKAFDDSDVIDDFSFGDVVQPFQDLPVLAEGKR